MKYVIDRGMLSSIYEQRYEKQDKTQGISYYLIVKEKVGEGEFGTQLTHYIRLKENTDKPRFDSYVGKIIKVSGPIYGRKTKDNTASFTTLVVESIDDIEIVD